MLKRFALAAVAIVLLSTTTTAVAALLELKTDIGLLTSGDKVDVGEGVLGGEAKGSRTIMVLGSDRRAADGPKAPSQSDTVMLIRLDAEKGATSILSLPRDLKVNIPGNAVPDKLNAAYARGGEELTIKTVKALLAPHSPTGKFPISHVVNINFGGFQRLVNYLDCVYIDVDRHYFNNNNPPAGDTTRYAEIDVPAGYQRMCGGDALSYVRYRHFDSDLVRGARQQEFLRQSKNQVGVDKLVSDRHELFKIIGRYMQTDIRGTGKLIGLLKLANQASKKPLREIPFPADSTGDGVTNTFVTITDADLDRTVKRFMDADLGVGKTEAPKDPDAGAKKTKKPTKKKKKNQSAKLPAGMQLAQVEGENIAAQLAPKLALPVLYPKAKMTGALYRSDDSRAYILKDKQNHKYPSYRMVVGLDRVLGQYYGIQGTRWENPPILEEETRRIKLGKREFLVFEDGNRIRTIALKTKDGAYWVSNSLLLSLTNQQMIAIARSLVKLGG
ncbi:MAG TPA: LCP family protein, partial [Baekduia sp.]|nr:LCP family protein [Baekduia sp.]